MKSLKYQLVKLAKENPELREHFLPLVSGKTANEGGLRLALTKLAYENLSLRSAILPLLKTSGPIGISDKEYDRLKKGDRLEINMTDSFSSGERVFEVGRKSFSKKWGTYSLRLYFVKDGVPKKSGMKIILFKRVEGSPYYRDGGYNVSLSMGGMGSQIKSWKKLS